MQIAARFSDADGNIDLALFNPAGSVVAVANSETDDEKISYRAIQDGTYTARVQLTGGVPLDGVPYRLQVTKSCPDDSFEENDTVVGASPVSLPFNFAGLRACPADEDWFSFPLSAGQQIQVNALFFHAAGGNIDLSLRDPNGALVDFSGSPTDNEKITHTAAKDGTYAIGVSILPGARDEGNGYWLQISAAATPLTCLDDAFEDNDTRESAAAVSLPFSQPGLAVCFDPEDEDWFSFPLSTGAAVQVDASFIHDEGNINIRLFRDGTPVAQSISLDDNEKIDFTATVDGTYTLQVDPLPDPFSDPGNTYTLEISATCVSDVFEPNDSLVAAAPVSLPLSEEALTICPEDQDYYSFPLTEGGIAQIDASFNTAEGDINIRLFDPDGAVVAQSTSETDGEKISYTAAITGLHVLQVELLPDLLTAPGNSYGLEVSATEPPPTPTPPADADLVVKGINISPPKPEAGESFDIIVEVSNLGLAPAGGFVIDFYADLPGSPAPGQTGNFLCNVEDGLAAGATFECSDSGSFSNPGSYEMWAQVDTDGDVDEADEDNNVFGPQKLEVNEPGAPTATPTSPPTNTPPSTNTPVSTPTNTPSPGLLGDVNCNQAVDAIDAALLLQLIAGLLSSLDCEADADVNLDGNSNSIDVALILQFIAGLLADLPP